MRPSPELIDYILSFLLRDESLRGLVEYRQKSAACASSSDAKVVIEAADFWDAPYVPAVPLPTLDSGTPLLFGSPTIRREGEKVILGADIVASAFFLLSRCEEVLRCEVRDEHGRFPARESLAMRAGFLTRPIVDEYGVWLRKILRGVYASRVADETPRSFSKVFLTHDVDIAWHNFKSPRQVIAATLHRLRLAPRLAWRPAACALLPHGERFSEPYTFLRILELDNSVRRALGAERCESIFFLLHGNGAPQDVFQFHEKSRRQRLIALLRGGGASLEYHATYAAGGDPSRLAAEISELRNLTGLALARNRNHFLRQCSPDFLAALEKGGVTDDFSAAYADAAGFRLGTTHAVRRIDPVSGALGTLLVHPLTIMECTLDSARYMNLPFEEAKKLCVELIERTRDFGGELDLLWHNTTVSRDSFAADSYQPALYEFVCNYLRENP